MFRHAVRRLAPAAEGQAVTNRLLLTISSPHKNWANKKVVDTVTVPGRDGTFTVSNNHSLIVSQLQAGKITVRADGESTDYFISDGYAFFNHPSDDSGCCELDIAGVELVPCSYLDKDKAASMLGELSSGPKETEWDKCKIQTGTALLGQVIKCAAD